LSSIPIDIAANKLLDWLISRHHCTKDWPEKIAAVRQKINDALQDMPQNDTLAKILFEASRKLILNFSMQFEVIFDLIFQPSTTTIV